MAPTYSWASATPVSAETLARLRSVSSASISGTLQKMGANVRHAYMSGIRPIASECLVVGRAVTLRYVPSRADLREHLGSVLPSHQAVEALTPGDVLVVDALGSEGGGHFGDVMSTRVKLRGAGALVIDGAVRDLPYLRDMGLPIFARSATGPASPLTPIEHNVPIQCGGALVLPGDLIVADADGVCVLPAALAEEVARVTVEQEELEVFIREKLEEGRLLQDVYPPNDAVRREYASRRK
jgi:5-oxopent-3-ene-1,2,5-tricarboxylate decarboxylase/2-hydroxyhepta-2,4-diene-1,7-dioate isomerase